MPMRCDSCLLIGHKDSDITCPGGELAGKCHITRIETIHYAHPDGSGKLIGREVCGTKKTDLKLCCGSDIERPMYTPVLHAVTCPNCLENIPTPDAQQ